MSMGLKEGWLGKGHAGGGPWRVEVLVMVGHWTIKHTVIHILKKYAPEAVWGADWTEEGLRWQQGGVTWEAVAGIWLWQRRWTEGLDLKGVLEMKSVELVTN